MRTESRSGEIVGWIKNIPAMTATAHTVIDDEREYDIACAALAVGNVLRPAALPHAVAINARSGITSIAAIVSDRAVSLITAMFGCRLAQAGRESEARLGLSRTQESDGFIQGADSFVRSEGSFGGRPVYCPRNSRASVR
jgi:hypothetical protein